MTIASAARGGFLILVCLCLSGCSAHKRAEAIAQAAPYVSDALTQPIPLLYDATVTRGNADDRLAGDELRLGLALSAGRPSPAVPSDADLRNLATIDARFQAAKRAWLKENPPGSENEVPWALQIGLTADEAAVVTRIGMATSADYWLSQARDATTIRILSTQAQGYHFSVAGVQSTVPAIDTRVLLTAEACVNAVRQSAGVRAAVLPEVVLRLSQEGVGLSMVQAVPDPTSLKPGRDFVTGPAACGSDETFSRYIALLKAAKLSDAPPHRR